MIFYTVTDYFDPIGQKRISSKCPDCGQKDCLELNFYQKRTETGFSKKVSKKVSGKLYCHHTNTEISPVQWTDEIENHYLTEKEKLRLNPSQFKLTKWFYMIVFIPLGIILAAVGYGAWEHQQFNSQTANIANASIGDKVYTMLTVLDENKSQAFGNTWLLVKGIDGDTIFLQRHRDFTKEEGFEFNLDNTNFSGDILKASLSKFKERSIAPFDYSKDPFSGYITEINK